MEEIAYARPQTVEEAARLLSADGACALAGGTDLIVQLREGRRRARTVVDLKRIPELLAVAPITGGGWRIGGAASVGALGKVTDFADMHAGLLESARLIGSLQIQNRASLGGNVCNAAPSADAAPLLMCLSAEAEIAGQTGRRTVAIADLFHGPGRTTLSQGELLVSMILPALNGRWSARYRRFTPRREMDIAVAGAGAVIELQPDGTIAAARVVLASVAPVPLRAQKAEQVLIGGKPSASLFAAAGATAAAEARPISDTRGSAEYRRELVAVLTRRALQACAQDLGIEAS